MRTRGVRAARMPALSVACLLGSAVTAATEGSEANQGARQEQVTVVDTMVACRTCEISVTHLVTIGGVRDSVAAVGFPLVVQVNRRGMMYVVPRPSSQIAVYDQGGVLTQLIGRSGRGPGEFTAVSRILVDSNDSLIVFDDLGRRVSVFDSGGRYARSFVSPVFHTSSSTSVRLPDGNFVVGGMAGSPTSVGYPLHLVSADGRILSSFGAAPPRADPSYESGGFRLITLHDGSIWSARPDRYEIESWTMGGERRKTLRRPSTWFSPRYSEPKAVWGVDAPPPYLIDVQADPRGLLWTVLIVPRPDFKPPGEPRAYPLGEVATIYRTMIEIIDPNSGRVVARRIVPSMVHGFAAPGMIYSHREDAAGDLVYDVWRVQLEGL